MTTTTTTTAKARNVDGAGRGAAATAAKRMADRGWLVASTGKRLRNEDANEAKTKTKTQMQMQTQMQTQTQVHRLSPPPARPWLRNPVDARARHRRP
ncbi:MAG: hypothetical protein M1826_003216 [Phylliscum demangeonii]|nr:MAG: hypothetical protein M1826_003216 [Phylliscum demangeonii]